eukprot:TRINITY_DN80673_c0_g1_i1.p1 TRINITY_DN80673_c0_g1~~TRINITY_DN80673_c0_g1_i1.p1  ORF type:complete len:404 (+),score=105.26 TRINITY_DN80673_c0_g1_i1:117-1214(+)
MVFLKAAGFIDADDPDVGGDAGKGALLSMPVAYISRLTDAHHTLARIAGEAGMAPPPLPGSSFNPYCSSMSKTDSTQNAKVPNSYKNEADRLRDEVKKRQREMQDKVDQAPPVDLKPTAFWLASGKRLEDVIRETTTLDEERQADNALLQSQVAAAKMAIAGSNAKFESADKKRLAELSRHRVYQACILRVICPDKSVLQVHFRANEKGEQVLEALKPLLSPHVRDASWYIYQTPPLKKLQAQETLTGFTPGASLYLGFDGDKPAPPYLESSLVEQLGPAPAAQNGVTAPTFSGEAMGWGTGQTLGGSGERKTPAWLKQPKSGATGSSGASSSGPYSSPAAANGAAGGESNGGDANAGGGTDGAQ